MAVDAAGNLFLPGDKEVVKVAPSGQVSVTALPPDTPEITCLAVDAAGSVYFGHQSSPNPIRKVSAAGAVSVVDPKPVTCSALAFDSAGNLYIGDSGERRIHRKDASTGTLVHVAGNGSSAPATTYGVPATSASVGTPYGIVADDAGGFYFTDGALILRVDAGGIVSHVTGSRGSPPAVLPASQGSVGSNSAFYIMGGFTRDAAGNLYIASFFANQVFRVDPSDVVHVFAGSGPGGPTYVFSGDGGPATTARLAQPRSVVRDAAGNTYIADAMNNRIRKVDAAGNISSLGVGAAAGNGDGGAATSARLGGPLAVASRPGGGFAIADLTTATRVVDAGGTIGSPVSSVAFVSAAAYDASGNLYISDVGGARVLKRDASGNLTVYAGGNGAGFSGDGGPATAARLNGPRGLAFDAAGNLYIADQDNARVRRVAPDGAITTVAGNGTTTYVDGSAATATGVPPFHLAVDGAGNLYVSLHRTSASANHRVVKIDASGVVRNFAGTGASGVAGEGAPAATTSLAGPTGLAVDPSGSVYIAEGGAHRIRVVRPDGLIHTLAGSGAQGFSGDGGSALAAQLSSPAGLAWSATGEGLLVADSGNRRIRRIEVGDLTPDAFAFVAAVDVALTAVIQSAAVTPTGFSAPTSVSVSGGEYSVGCTGSFVSANGVLAPGQSICVRHTSSAVHNADVVTTLVVGGVAAAFRSTTVPGPGSVSVSAAGVDFGGQSMNTTSPASTLTLTNTGSVNVSLNALAASSGFAASSSCATLAPGASCPVDVNFQPTTQGPVSGSLTLRLSSGNVTLSLSGIGERSLATHYYRAILRRAPDVQGKEFWEGEATRLSQLGADPNEAWFSMAVAFFSSPEYLAFARSNTEFLVDVYKTFFNRPPDPSGAAFWGSQLGSGLPREVLLASFMFSPEFKAFAAAIFGAPTVRAEVDLVMDFYRLLGRLPDSEGLRHWVGRLRAAQCQNTQPGEAGAYVNSEVQAISVQFMASSEYGNRNRSNPQFVGDLYNGFLRRGGELSGVQFWIAQLNDGTRTREQLRAQFHTSPEFQQRVSRVVNQGCLP